MAGRGTGGLEGGRDRDGSAVACYGTQDCLVHWLHGDPEATRPGAKLRNVNNSHSPRASLGPPEQIRVSPS